MTNKDLGKIIRGFTLKYPFFGHLLMKLRKDIVTGEEHPVQTAAVSVDPSTLNINLTVNADFWGKLPLNVQEGVFYHEILHVAFRHLELHVTFPDKELANIAMDMEINQIVGKANLPEGGVFLDEAPFAELNLPKNKGSKFYYDALMSEKRKDNQKLMQGIADMLAQGGNNHDWDSVEGLTSQQKKLLKNQQDHILKEAVNDTGGPKEMGSMPGGLARALEKLFEKKAEVFNWKAFFRRYIGTIIDLQRKKTHKRASKRFEGSPGLRTKRKQRVFVSVDVSGSMSNKEIAEVFEQIDHIYRAGAEIHVITWDSVIHDRFIYAGKPPQKVHGGGGSNIGIAIAEYNKAPKDFTFAVHLTDGYVSNNEPLHGKHLFIITSEGQKFDPNGNHTMVQIPKSHGK